MNKKISKQERKEYIIYKALKLFAAKGYENTTIEDILKEVGLSKGGFYHHYISKEALLDDVVQLLIKDTEVIFKEIEKQNNLTAIEKTNEYIRKINSYKKEKPGEVYFIIAEIYSGGKNYQLEGKIYNYIRENISSIMKRIIFQGVEEGTFKTKFPEESAETFVKLMFMQQQEISELFYKAIKEKNYNVLETIKRKYKFFQILLEDALGIDRGVLVVEEVMSSTAEKLLKKILAEMK